MSIPARHRLHFLIGDDDAVVLATVADLVSSWGHRVYQAHTGRDALRILISQDIHITILDVHLPDAMGPDIIEEYIRGPLIASPREAPRRARPRSMPTIFMSGDADAQVRNRCAQGGWSLLDKPVGADDLRAEVNRILEQLHF